LCHITQRFYIYICNIHTMNTVLATIKLGLLLFLAASPQDSVKAQDVMETVEEMEANLAEDLEEITNALAVNEIVQIPALSYTDDEGMLAIPTVNLSDPTGVLALQELIRDQSCDCTSSGYSGISLSDEGALATYGNTTIMGCAAHDILQSEGIGADMMGCYVVGGTGCAEATASVLGSENEAFTMAGWRECNPLATKYFGYGGFQSVQQEKITIERTSHQMYQPPMCGYCGYQPMVPYNTGFCSGSATASATASAGGGSASASASSGGCGGSSAAVATSG